MNFYPVKVGQKKALNCLHRSSSQVTLSKHTSVRVRVRVCVHVRYITLNVFYSPSDDQPDQKSQRLSQTLGPPMKPETFAFWLCVFYLAPDQV